MTVQIDSLAIDTADVSTAGTDVDTDGLYDEVITLDAEILDAIERRTRLARTLAAATASATAPDAEATPYAELGSDGHVFSRMLGRLARVGR